MSPSLKEDLFIWSFYIFAPIWLVVTFILLVFLAILEAFHYLKKFFEWINMEIWIDDNC